MANIAKKAQEWAKVINKSIQGFNSLNEVLDYLKITLDGVKMRQKEVDFFTTEGQILALIESELKAQLTCYKRTPNGTNKGYWSPY